MNKATEPMVQRVSFEELLERDGVLAYTNVGCSMMPLLRQHRDIIEIRKKGPERCKKYDVVLYKRRNRYILHRILKVLPEGYLIAGDHCVFLERDITDKNILGVMTRVRRNGRDVAMDNLWYRLYVHLWCDCYPLRMLILRCKFLAWRVARRLLSPLKKMIFKK